MYVVKRNGYRQQISFDKDLWILEVEEKGGHGLLERPYLERG